MKVEVLEVLEDEEWNWCGAEAGESGVARARTSSVAKQLFLI